jgi:hypothetical protein
MVRGPMITQPRTCLFRWSPWLGPISLMLITAAILFMRRPDQFLAPYIWVEDGRFILREYLEQGWQTILNPLAGYLVLSTKIIAYLSFKTSILHAPEIELALTILLTFGVVAAVAFSPTHLQYRPLCALSVLLVPTAPEVYAVSLYAFWWAAILYLLAILWDEARGKVWLRYAFIVFGGLSSPLAVSLFPAFIVRAIVERRGWLAAALASLVAAIQVIAMMQQRLSAALSTLDIHAVHDSLARFAGDFLFDGAGLPGALLLFVFCGGVIVFYRRRFQWHFWFLVGVYAVICASVAARLLPDTLSIIAPFTDGVRYFFYPFILLSWLLLWVAKKSNGAVRAIVAAIFAVSVLSSGRGLTSHHVHFSWRDEMLKCANSETYRLPIHFMGAVKDMWNVEFKGSECQAMIDRSLF